METALLRSCLSLPKVTHLLRTCPPDVIQSALVKFDEIMRDAVSDLAGCPLSDWAWLKSSLPSSLGGLNIRHATLYAPAAFIGSIHQSEPPSSPIFWVILLKLHYICPMPSMPWPNLLLDQTGSPLKALMFLFGATLSPIRSMAPVFPSSWRAPLMFVLKPLPYRLPSLMLEIG